MCQGNYRSLAAIDEEDIYIFERKYQKERVLVIINAGEEERQIDLGAYLEKEDSGDAWVNLESKEAITNSVVVCGKMQGMAWKMGGA